MYFFDLQALKRQLAAGPLASRQALLYVLVHGILASGLVLLFQAAPVAVNSWDRAGDATSVVLFALGIVWAYRRNGGARGKDFLGRALSLGWVIGLRVFVPALLTMLAGMLILAWSGPVPEETTWLEALVWLSVEVLFYCRLAKHIGDLATAGDVEMEVP